MSKISKENTIIKGKYITWRGKLINNLITKEQALAIFVAMIKYHNEGNLQMGIFLVYSYKVRVHNDRAETEGQAP